MEKQKIQQSILMSRNEEARQAKMRAQQDAARKQHQLDYIARLNADRRQRIRIDEEIARQKAEALRRKKIEDARAEV